MPRQLLLTCMVDLPDDLFSSAEVALTIKPAWETFIAALKTAKVPSDTKIETIDTKVPRKPRVLRKAKSGAIISEPAAEEV